MHASTHGAITEAVSRKLGVYSPTLVEASTEPDRIPDYQAQPYLTRTGRLRVREARVRHHGTSPGLMKSLAVKSRHLFLSSLGARPEEGLPEVALLLQRSPLKWKILQIVSEREPGGILVTELVGELAKRGVETDRMTVSDACKKLFRKGWITREPEGKTFRVRLSDFGRKVFAKG
jgi:hypothetical protein